MVHYSFASLQPHPLTPWGSFSGQRRLSDSPYIESVWEGVAVRDGNHLTAADGTIDFTLLKRQGVTHMLLSGPTSRVCDAAFKAGDEVVTMRLRPGVHLPFAKKLADVDQTLANAMKNNFWLHSTAIAFPSFTTTETFALSLARLGLLRRDIVVEDVLANRNPKLSPRMIQRHFVATTGLTMSHIRQIRRAEQARNLLTGSHTLTAIAYETGYSNPGHMTNAFNYFFGQTPSALRALMTQ